MNVPRPFQKVLIDFGTLNNSFIVELNVNEFSESARVIVSNSLRIAERCRKEQFLLNRTF